MSVYETSIRGRFCTNSSLHKAGVGSYIYAGNYEKVTEGDITREFYYLDGNVIVIKQDGVFTPYLAFKDNLGSFLSIMDAEGEKVFDADYDAWGKQTVHLNEIGFQRGYTGHEMWNEFGIINMNGRLYDPAIARFLSPDNYVQAPDNSQSFNRYSYCLNNPLKYNDPSGDFWEWIIGAAIGVYFGGVLSNDSYNPTKWDYSSAQTWRYMTYGGISSAASGYLGGAIASSGGAFANTMSIATASFVNSVGTNLYTNGKTPVSISFGAFSYDMTNNKFGRLGKKGNSKLDNWMYSLGALANVSDVLIGLNPRDIDLVTSHEEKGAGHSSLVENGSNKKIISVGPIQEEGTTWHWCKGTNDWNTHVNDKTNLFKNTLSVNKKTVESYADILNNNSFHYSVELSSCVTNTSIALNLSGVFNIGIHPYLLQAQMNLWANGVRPWFVCMYQTK